MAGNPLRVAMIITADAKSVAPATAEAREGIQSVTKAANENASAERALATATAEAGRAQQVAVSIAQGRSATEMALRAQTMAGAGATKLAAHEVTNLTRQFSDLGVMLASGQSPLMAMITQGPQIADIFGQRGLRQILSGVVAGIGSMINPVTLVLAGITALGYGASYVFDQLNDDVSEADRQLEEHAELIASVAKRWGDVYPELKAYNDELQRQKDIGDLIAAQKLIVAKQYETPAEQLPDLGAATVNVAFLMERNGADPAAINRFRAEYEELVEKTKAGTATGRDALDVQQLLSAEFVRSSKEAKEYSDQLGELAKQLDAANKNSEPHRNNQGALGMDPSGLRQVLTLNRLATEDKKRRDEDAENKRLGALVPIPTARPNDIERLDQEPASPVSQLLRRQDEELEKLRVEATLIGASRLERERAIAAMEAEREIRESGIDRYGAEAEAIRRNAAAIAEQTVELERTTEAYRNAQRAGESMVDGVVDKLMDGDWKGALKSLAGDIWDFTKELTSNQLKNSIYGTDYPTASSFGSGPLSWLGALFGRKPSSAANDNFPAAPAGNSLDYKSIFGAANDNYSATAIQRQALPPVAGGTGSIGDIAAYIEQAATARGIDAAVALKVARSEGLGAGIWQSNYRNAAGVREPSFGPFQLLKGGQGTGFGKGLGNAFMTKTGLDPADPRNVYPGIDFALDHAAENGWGAWYGAAKVGVSNKEGLGGARAIGITALDTKAAAAARSLDVFGTGSVKAAESLAGGIGKLGSTLSQFPAAPSMGGGGGGGWLQSLLGMFRRSTLSPGTLAALQSSPGGLYAKGGITDRPSIFGEAGIEAAVPLPDGRSIPVTMSMQQTSRPSNDDRPRIIWQNNGTPKELIEEREEDDGQGGKSLTYVLDDAVASVIAKPGSRSNRRLGAMGAASRPILRG